MHQSFRQHQQRKRTLVNSTKRSKMQEARSECVLSNRVFCSLKARFNCHYQFYFYICTPSILSRNGSSTRLLKRSFVTVRRYIIHGRWYLIVNLVIVIQYTDISTHIHMQYRTRIAIVQSTIKASVYDI